MPRGLVQHILITIETKLDGTDEVRYFAAFEDSSYVERGRFSLSAWPSLDDLSYFLRKQILMDLRYGRPRQ